MNGKEIRLIRKKMGLTQPEFASLLNYSLSMIQKWETGVREIDAFNANVIKELESNSINEVQKKAQILQSENKLNEFSLENQVGVPYYDVDFAGGWNSDELFATQLPLFKITSPDFQKAEFACNLIGNSISRRIPNRAIIGLREIQEWQIYFPTNELYAVLMKNELRTVKVVKRGKSRDTIILIPDPLPEHNQTVYEPEEVPIAFVSKFFQVVAWAQFEKLAM